LEFVVGFWLSLKIMARELTKKKQVVCGICQMNHLDAKKSKVGPKYMFLKN